MSLDTDGFREIKGPIDRYFPFPQPLTKGVQGIGGRDGLGWPEKELQRYVCHAVWATTTERTLMNVEEQLATNYQNVEKLWLTYKEKLDAFRSVAKNDMSSLEAAARKTTEAAHKLNSSYGEVIAQLNGLEMRQAIENAERLAAAMKAISELQSHRLTFAVIDSAKA